MKIELKTRIEQPIAHVWKVLAEEFNEISHWFDGVVASYEIPDGDRLEGAPTAGRVCQLSDSPVGPKLIETITEYDAANHRLSFDVELQGTSAAVPVKSNRATMSLRELPDGATELLFEAAPELKAHGYLMYPLLKMGLSKNLQGLLDSLKQHTEARFAA